MVKLTSIQRNSPASTTAPSKHTTAQHCKELCSALKLLTESTGLRLGILGIVDTTSPTCRRSAPMEQVSLVQQEQWPKWGMIGAHQPRYRPGHSPVQSLHSIVVFPALSSPSTRMRASFSPKRPTRREIHSPMASIQRCVNPHIPHTNTRCPPYIQCCTARTLPTPFYRAETQLQYVHLILGTFSVQTSMWERWADRLLKQASSSSRNGKGETAATGPIARATWLLDPIPVLLLYAAEGSR